MWQVPADPKHPEGVRYRMALIPKGHRRPAVLYDNHHPKGHHKHWEGTESSYAFSGIGRLIQDFEREVEDWKKVGRGP